MKLFVCAAFYAYPPAEGVDAQLTDLLDELSSRGHDIVFLPIVRSMDRIDSDGFGAALPRVELLDPIVYPRRYPVLALELEAAAVGYRSRVISAIERAIRAVEPDIVHLQGFGLTPALSPLRRYPVVFSAMDAWSLRQGKLARQSLGPRSALLQAYARWALSIERRHLHRARAVQLVAQEEADYLAAVNPRAKVGAIPLMCRLPAPGPAASRDPCSALFWGDIRVPYLRDGLVWLLKEVWPQVEARVPEARLTAVTRDEPDREMAALAGPSVHFTRWMDDVDADLQRHGIVLLPDQSGSGQKNRTLAALANGNAVLGTRFALEGLETVENVHALRLENSAQAARDIVELMRDAPRQRRLGEEGRLLVRSEYSTAAVVAKWEGLYEKARPSSQGAAVRDKELSNVR